MGKIPVMVDMELTDEEKVNSSECAPIPCKTPDYPWGLRLTLSARDLAKMKIDPASIEMGGVIHLHALARITGKFENETENSDGKDIRVEAQITHLSTESEDAENAEADKPVTTRRKFAYQK